MKKIYTSIAASLVLATSLNAGMVSNEDFNEFADEIEERIDSIETRSLLNGKLLLGVNFHTGVENQSIEMADGSKYTQENIWRTYVDINLVSNLSKTVKFTGQLSMNKNWGGGFNMYGWQDFAQGNKPTDSSVWMRRAYLDWVTHKNKKFMNVITIGRQPASDGPSSHFKNGEVRQGTYNVLAFDGASEGIVNSLIFDKLGTFRVAYGKVTQAFNEDNMNNNPYIGVDTDIEDTGVLGLFYEKNFGNNWMQLGHTTASNINAPTATGSIGEDVGDASITTVSFEANNIKDSGVSLYGHWGRSTIEPNGNVQSYDQGMTWSNGNSVTADMGLLTQRGLDGTIDSSKKTGDAIWLGASKSFENGLTVTAEWNKGDQYWFNFTQGSRGNALNKLATRGTATDLTITKKFSDDVVLKVGVTNVNYDYSQSGSFLGTPMSKENIEDYVVTGQQMIDAGTSMNVATPGSGDDMIHDGNIVKGMGQNMLSTFVEKALRVHSSLNIRF